MNSPLLTIAGDSYCADRIICITRTGLTVTMHCLNTYPQGHVYRFATEAKARAAQAKAVKNWEKLLNK